MKTKLAITVFSLLTIQFAFGAESPAKQFLRYCYGEDGIDISRICLPSPDLWMLREEKNTNLLEQIKQLNIPAHKHTGVFCEVVETNLFVVELRNGKVDPAFDLETIYTSHRQIVLNFVSATLDRDKAKLRHLTTDPSKIKIIGPEAASGDMDQYDSIIALFPVVRISKPEDDQKSHTVSYRIPLGEAGLNLTLLRKSGQWKIDTSKTIQVPLQFFFK